MKLRRLLTRFATPPLVVSLIYALRHRCAVSPRAEVELTPNLVMGRGTVIGSFTKVKAAGPLSIGSRVQIGTGCFLSAESGGVTIGDDCMIGPNASIVGNNYRYDRLDVPMQQQEKTSKGIRIGDDVWIAAGAVVLDGARIESGAIVAPNSVVSGKIPKNSIAQGNPARVVFRRR